jgi:plastocyanin
MDPPWYMITNMLDRRTVLRLAAAASIPLAGCTDDGGGGATPTADMDTEMDGDMEGDGGADVTVTLEGTSFITRTVEVEPGGTVRWVNESSFGHDVTAAQFHDVAADWTVSESLSANGATTYTFEEAGIYEYYCTIHGQDSMCGAVLVGGATLEQDLPCASGGEDAGPY